MLCNYWYCFICVLVNNLSFFPLWRLFCSDWGRPSRQYIILPTHPFIAIYNVPELTKINTKVYFGLIDSTSDDFCEESYKKSIASNQIDRSHWSHHIAYCNPRGSHRKISKPLPEFQAILVPRVPAKSSVNTTHMIFGNHDSARSSLDVSDNLSCSLSSISLPLFHLLHMPSKVTASSLMI